MLRRWRWSGNTQQRSAMLAMLCMGEFNQVDANSQVTNDDDILKQNYELLEQLLKENTWPTIPVIV